VTDWRIFIRSN